jgi:hypothetical protein
MTRVFPSLMIAALVALILSPTVGGYLARATLTLPYALVTGDPVNVDIWGGLFVDCTACNPS